MGNRLYIIPSVGMVALLGCCISASYRQYVIMNAPVNEVTASTVIVIDNTACTGYVISVLEQASPLEESHQRDDDNDFIPEPIQITQTASSAPIIAQSCSAYR